MHLTQYILCENMLWKSTALIVRKSQAKDYNVLWMSFFFVEKGWLIFVVSPGI